MLTYLPAFVDKLFCDPTCNKTRSTRNKRSFAAHDHYQARKPRQTSRLFRVCDAPASLCVISDGEDMNKMCHCYEVLLVLCLVSFGIFLRISCFSSLKWFKLFTFS
jgi:hypothetical protein